MPSPIYLCSLQRLELLLASPRQTSKLKHQTADLLSQLDRFDEALAEYRSIEDVDQNWIIQLKTGRLLLAIGGHDHILEAKKCFDFALSGAPDPIQKSRILSDIGNLHWKDRDVDEAREYLLAGLKINPADQIALRRYAIVEFNSGRVSDLIDQCEKLVAMGVRHNRLTATLFAALAASGKLDKAREIRGFGDYFWEAMLDAPKGFSSIGAFNAALVDELFNHPALRFENSRRASESSWRVDELLTRSANLTALLLEKIAAQVELYAKRQSDGKTAGSSRLFNDLLPASAKILPWSVITREKGYEKWHVHDGSWLSGVYYAAVPSGLAGGDGKAGAIEFGWPEQLLGEGASERLGNQIIHPEPGMLLLFPSHIHHRTWPHGKCAERICVSFDVIPDP